MNITPFNFNSQEIRTVQHEDGSIWFVAKDVCYALDIDNVSQALSRLDTDEVSDLILNDSSQERCYKIIDESGLYSLTLTSRKPEAKVFKKWVTSEVLPSIRKTGSYSNKPLSPAEQLLAQAQLMVNIEQEQKVIKSEIAEVKDRLENIETPKVLKEKPDGYDSATNIAKTLSKRFGMSPTHVRNIIRIFVTGEFKDTFEDNPKDSSETFEHDCFDIEECGRVVFEVFEQAIPINRKDTFTHNKYTQNFKIDHETKEWVRPAKSSL
jgi:prophage antirepressor-like protein